MTERHMKKVLVTGATGFVGGHVVEELLRRGYEVSALARNPRPGGGPEKSGAKFHAGNVLRAETLDFAGFDAVIHLVGIIVERGEQTFERVHTEGAKNVVDAAKRAEVARYVHMSALGARPGAASRYHKSKYAAEEYVRASGLDYVILRPSVIFGRGGEFTKMLVDFFRNPLFVPVIGSGMGKLQPVSAVDVARCFAAALTSEKATRGVFELGGPQVYAFNELLDEVGRQLGKKRLKIHAPLFVGKIMASLFERFLEKPPLTRDQLIMLGEDSVCDNARAAEAFGIAAWEPFTLPAE